MELKINNFNDLFLPTSHNQKQIGVESDSDYSFQKTLSLHGYNNAKIVTETLQGFVCLSNKNNTKVIIKVANIKLHNQKEAIVGGKKCSVKENLVQEFKILKHLQLLRPPSGIVKAVDFFFDEKNLFLVEEYCGIDVFKYVSQKQMEIKSGKIDYSQWKTHIKVLIKQFLFTLKWLHKTGFCCHLDISLENMVINGVEYDYKKRMFIKHGTITLIDFGLAEYFGENNTFICDKFIGKPKYQAPEVYNKIKYDARKAESWSAAVCVYMMHFGVPAYNIPSLKDPYFSNLWYGYLKEQLNDWGFVKDIDDVLGFLAKVFKESKTRLSIEEMLEDEFMIEQEIGKKKQWE